MIIGCCVVLFLFDMISFFCFFFFDRWEGVVVVMVGMGWREVCGIFLKYCGFGWWYGELCFEGL